MSTKNGKPTLKELGLRKVPAEMESWKLDEVGLLVHDFYSRFAPPYEYSVNGHVFHTEKQRMTEGVVLSFKSSEVLPPDLKYPYKLEITGSDASGERVTVLIARKVSAKYLWFPCPDETSYTCAHGT